VAEVDGNRTSFKAVRLVLSSVALCRWAGTTQIARPSSAVLYRPVPDFPWPICDQHSAWSHARRARRGAEGRPSAQPSVTVRRARAQQAPEARRHGQVAADRWWSRNSTALLEALDASPLPARLW